MDRREHKALFDTIAGEAVTVVGRTGSGKSYCARGFIEIALNESRRLCIIDPTGVHWGLRSSSDGDRPAFPIVVFGGDHADVAIADTSGAALAELLAGQNLPAIVDVSEFSRSGMVRFMGPFLDSLYRHNKTPLTLVVDEADIFAPQRPEPETATMLGRMEQIVRRGRVRGFRPWLITQRPASLNKNVLSQANTLIAMQLTAPQDRDAIGAWIEGQADRDEGRKVLAELPRLKKGEGYVWAPSHGVLERVTFPRIATFDSGRTPEEGEAPPALALADVDLSGIAESLKRVSEESQANDPKVLRARILELERLLQKRPDLSSDALEREFARGYADCAAKLGAVREAISRVRGTIDGIDVSLCAIAAAHEAPAPAPAPPVREVVATKARLDDWIPLKHPAQINGARSADKPALSKAERKILTAVVQFPRGRTRSQISILSGYSSSSSHFDNTLGSLRSKGLISRGEPVVATDEGRAALGKAEPLPTGWALREMWLGKLGKAERALLEALIQVYPRPLTRADLSRMTGYSDASSHFDNSIGRLRTLDLAVGRGEIRACEDLFE
jgi:hypothetical protein